MESDRLDGLLENDTTPQQSTSVSGNGCSFDQGHGIDGEQKIKKTSSENDCAPLTEEGLNISSSREPQHNGAGLCEHLCIALGQLVEDVLLHGTQRRLADHAPSYLSRDLCKYCAIIFDNWVEVVAYFKRLEGQTPFPGYISTPYFETVQEIEESADQGCAICAKLATCRHQVLAAGMG